MIKNAIKRIRNQQVSGSNPLISSKKLVIIAVTGIFYFQQPGWRTKNAQMSSFNGVKISTNIAVFLIKHEYMGIKYQEITAGMDPNDNVTSSS